MGNELSELVRDVREEVQYLRELGVETLGADLPEVAVEAPASHTRSEPVQLPPSKPEVKPQYPTRATGTRLASLPSLAKRTPAAVKVEIDSSPEVVSLKKIAESAASVEETMFGDIAGLPDSTETIEDIWADIGNCTRCPLHEGRTQIVQTVGNYKADLMFIGEAPGRDEDAQGEPFVGRAGQLLNKIIEAIGMKREEVCIGNINSSRPPVNSKPTLPEAHTCKKFIHR
jgi:DNA polymerase